MIPRAAITLRRSRNEFRADSLPPEVTVGSLPYGKR
jgi:hypothetical protein